MKKVKKYAGGTSEDDISKLKEEGLKASKDDKVGLLDRLRMGNIDDPKSEAYKRFGAGRGLAERSKATPVTPPSTEFSRGFPGLGAPVMPKPVEPTPNTTPVGLRGALTPQGTGEGGASPGVKGPDVAPKPRRRPVAKQNTKPINISTGASGFGTDEKGIAQRRMEGLKAPKTSELRSVARTRAGTAVPEDNTGKLAATMAGLGAAGMGLKGLRQRLMRPEAGGGSMSRELSSSPGNRPRLMGLDPMMDADLERMAGEGGPNFKKGGKVKAKHVKKYASGGKVSSASNRADGIAKRGKTKCKVY